MSTRSSRRLRQVTEQGEQQAVTDNGLEELTRQVQEHVRMLGELVNVPTTLEAILAKLQDKDEGAAPSTNDAIASGDGLEEIMDYLDDEEGQIIDTDRDDDDAIKQIIESMESKVELGPPVADIVARGFLSSVSAPTAKEAFDQLNDRAKIPENVQRLTVPRVNPEMWSILNKQGRIADVKLQGIQQCFSIGLTNLAKLADSLIALKEIPVESRKTLLRLAMDGGRALGNGFFELSMKRRNDMRPFVNAEYADVCSSRHEVTEFLFGNNLGDKLKEVKNTSELVKKTAKSYRPKPYARSSYRNDRQANLNFNRPSFQSKRFGVQQNKTFQNFQSQNLHKRRQ